MWWCRHWKIPPTDPRADAPLYEMERWYMLEVAHHIAITRDKSVEDVEFEEAFGHEASEGAETYAGILDHLIEQAGGFSKLDAKRLTLLEEQARELAAKRRKKDKSDV